jgi:hypothetical protein
MTCFISSSFYAAMLIELMNMLIKISLAFPYESRLSHQPNLS